MIKANQVRALLALASLLVLTWGCAEEVVPTGVGSTDMSAAAVPDTAGTDEVDEAPTIDRLEISPEEIVVGREIRVLAEASDPEGGPVRFTFIWTRNGHEVSRGSKPAMTFFELDRDDSVVLEAIASDGRNESSATRLRATVGNRKPTLTKLEMEPAGDVRAGMLVTATPYASDPDNDRLEFEYVWSVDGAEKGTERSFDTTGMRRGSELKVQVRATDGEAKSSPHEIALTLGNTPPTIQSDGENSIAGLYQHQFVGLDPDGDRNLRFFLEQGPAGMSMDAITGMLSWTTTDVPSGRHDVVVGVKDSQGDGTSFSFAVTVAAPDTETPPAAPAP